MSIQVSIKGLKILNDRISDLPAELLKSAERAVLSAGGKPILQAAKANAPIGHGPAAGLLKKSMGLNVKRTKGVWSARVGPRVGFGKKIGEGKRRKARYAKTRRHGKIKVADVGGRFDIWKDPVKYSHLVELGTSKMPASGFIRRAVDSSAAGTFDAMADGLNTHLNRTVARLRRKAGLPT